MKKLSRPDESELLAFLDEELTPQRQAEVRQQLAADWELRAQVAKLERRVEQFVDATAAFQEMDEQLPLDDWWRDFSGRLAATADKPVWQARVATEWRLLFTKLADWMQTEFRLRLMISATAGLIVVAALALLFWQSERSVSAQELLQRTTQAEAASLRRVGEPVVYRKLQIKRSGTNESVQWESWNDAARKQFRQRVADQQGLRFLRAYEKNTPAVIAELEQIFRANHFDAQRPLSAAAFGAWRAGIRRQTETVTDSKDGLQLTTIAVAPYALNAIIEASLTVRRSDWHAVALHLHVQGENEIRRYELSETAYEVLPLNALTVFADLAPTPSLTAAPMATAAATPASAAVAPSVTPSSASPATTASAELEIETLALLSQAGADLGEQINVTRTPQNTLRIAGLVETEERRQQLRRALAAVLRHPAVRFEIETVDEAVRRNQQTKRPATAPPPVIIEQPAIAASRLPVDAELRRYFSGQVAAAQLDEEIHQFARRTLNASFNLRQRAQAMKRLSERFTPAEWQTLDETAQAKLLNLLRTHASAMQSQTRTLRQSLQPVFGNAELPATESEINNEAELLRAVTRLTELSATSDRTIQAAFTISAEAVSTSALKSAAFWRALAGVEQLAAKIQTNPKREKR